MAKKKDIVLDTDTQKVLDGQQLDKELVESGLWIRAKKKLMDKIVANSSLMRINIAKNSTNEEVARELTARSLAASYVLQWLTDIEGSATQYQSNLELLSKSEEDELFSYFPQKVESENTQ